MQTNKHGYGILCPNGRKFQYLYDRAVKGNKYGIIKWDRQYKRIRRRGLKSVIFEFMSICIGFNLYKYHLKKQKGLLAA